MDFDGRADVSVPRQLLGVWSRVAGNGQNRGIGPRRGSTPRFVWSENYRGRQRRDRRCAGTGRCRTRGPRRCRALPKYHRLRARLLFGHFKRSGEFRIAEPEHLAERYSMRKPAVILSLLASLFFVSCNSGGGDATSKEFKLAFVTNNPADFWTIARRGVEKADEELT